MIRRIAYAAFAISLGASAALAQAAPPAQAPAARNACRADIRALCAGIQPGGGRMAACLREKQAQLSPACREQIAAVRTRGQAMRQACAGDIKNVCAGVQPGGGRIAACLREKESQLSESCKSARVAASPRR